MNVIPNTRPSWARFCPLAAAGAARSRSVCVIIPSQTTLVLAFAPPRLVVLAGVCVFGSSWFYLLRKFSIYPSRNHRFHHITSCNSFESLVLRSLRVCSTKIEIPMFSHHRPIHKLRTIVPVNVDVHGSSQNNLAITPKYRPYFTYAALSLCSTTQNEHKIGRK